MKRGREAERLMDPTFVAANRQGRLDRDQAAELRHRARRSRLVRSIEALAFVGLGALLVALVVPGNATTPDTDPVLIAGILVLLALAFMALRPWADPLGDDVRVGRVDSTFGVPQHSDETSGLARAVMMFVHSPSALFVPSTHFVSIGDRRFVVAASVADVLRERQAVRAYYLPRSMTLVSIAPF
jgi:hypothetical protein